jgi:hypothetical protein
MVGSFSSAAQAQQDSSYYDISLHMYPIWESRDSTDRWLYVEQAMATMQEKPYRQRVYRVEVIDDSTWKSSVYTLANPEGCIGKWREPEFFDAIKESELTLREGCAVYLRKAGNDGFRGSTRGKACESNLRGATYATSTVDIQPGRIESWDQGFDAGDTQVWGATGGGYVFLRANP